MKMVNSIGYKENNYDSLINEAIEHGYTTNDSITSYLFEIYKTDNINNKKYTFKEWLEQLD